MRIDFDILPASVRAVVEERTGRVQASRSATSGVNSALAAILETECGRVFLKGASDEDPRAVAGQQREVEVNAAVAGTVSPRLLWHTAAGEWHLAAFEAIDGGHADCAPGSPDLPKVAATLSALAEVPCPPVPMLSAWRRWGSFLDNPDDAKYFDGTALLHTDANPSNYLVNDGRAWLVDWAWGTRGAAFIDVALTLPRLIDAGHTIDEAEAWAGQQPVWQAADPAAIALFAGALARQWCGFADKFPRDSWRREMADATAAWADGRTRASARRR